MVLSVKSNAVLIPRNWAIGACCLGLPKLFRVLKELLSMYLGMCLCYFYLYRHGHHHTATSMSNNKSPATSDVNYFYSLSFPLLLRIQATKTNCFCKVRKWDMFLDTLYHIVPIYPLPKMPDLCALTALSCASWRPFDTLSAGSSSPHVTSEQTFKQDKVAVESLS